MKKNEKFSRHALDSIVGGVSAIDTPRLEVHNLDEAYQFLGAYGYDLNEGKDLEEVWSFHRRAVALLRDDLLNEGEIIPEKLVDPNQLQDVADLLVFASSEGDKELQHWSCAILRVMHAYAHIENDLFSQFREQIQDQVLNDFRSRLSKDPVSGVALGHSQHSDQIKLHRFDVKPFKTTSSSVVKLLSRRRSVAINLLDKLGVRFVTRDIYDAFRVIRFLVEEHIISFPNSMPDQARNTLYPVNLFMEVMNETGDDATEDEIHSALKAKLENAQKRAEYVERENQFSGQDFTAIKFISRKLIEIEFGEKLMHFFFPFEVQIIDYDTYLKTLSGPSSHDSYKERQREAARRRVLGFGATPK